MSSKRAGSKWIINDGRDREFDAVVVAVGTCGVPEPVDIPGLPKTEKNGIFYGSEDPHDSEEGAKSGVEIFRGEVIPWQALKRPWFFQEKTVLVVGYGVRGIEAVKDVLEKGAKHCVIVAHDDKVRSNSRPRCLWQIR